MPNPKYVRHWHVYSSFPGCLPDGDQYTTDDAAHALDHFAHLINDWADAQPDENVQVLGIVERCCSCQPSQHAEYDVMLAHVMNGRALCEYLGGLFYELVPCNDAACLKYCPDPECGTVMPINECDHRCWCCGAVYVAHGACAWII